MSYARRSDDNQSAILTALKRVTFAVSVHRTGALGFDVLARHVTTKLPVFIEIKNPKRPPSKRRLTANESKMAVELPLVYRKVETLDEALRAVGL